MAEAEVSVKLAAQHSWRSRVPITPTTIALISPLSPLSRLEVDLQLGL